MLLFRTPETIFRVSDGYASTGEWGLITETEIVCPQFDSARSVRGIYDFSADSSIFRGHQGVGIVRMLSFVEF